MKLIQLMTLSRSVYQIIFNNSRAGYNLPTFIDQTQFSKRKQLSTQKQKKQLSNQTVQ